MNFAKVIWKEALIHLSITCLDYSKSISLISVKNHQKTIARDIYYDICKQVIKVQSINHWQSIHLLFLF